MVTKKGRDSRCAVGMVMIMISTTKEDSFGMEWDGRKLGGAIRARLGIGGRL